MVRWDAAEKSAKPFDDDNGAAFYDRMTMCDEAFQKARDAIAKARDTASVQAALDALRPATPSISQEGE